LYHLKIWLESEEEYEIAVESGWEIIPRFAREFWNIKHDFFRALEQKPQIRPKKANIFIVEGDSHSSIVFA